jgi:TolB protein
VREGEWLRVRYSAWCRDVYRVELGFLGDVRDSPPANGWRVVASANNRAGGTYSMSTAGLYPGTRVFRVTAYYPGGSANCYGTFRVVGVPKTPTPPAPALAACPTCVEPLLYQSNPYGDWDIFVADADGSEPRRLTGDPADDISPAWHPSGGFIAFQSKRDGNWEIYTMNADGSKQLDVSNNPAADGSPAWSCRYIFFQSDRDGNWEMYRMLPDGSEQTRLTDNLAADAQPAVSCNNEVAFQSNRDGNWELYVMDSDGDNVRRLTNTAWDEVSPTWSPDGQWIAFQTRPYGTWKLAAVNATGRELRYIARTFASTESPAWYPYCEWIYFQSNRNGVIEELYRTKWDTDKFERLTWTPFVHELIDFSVLP